MYKIKDLTLCNGKRKKVYSRNDINEGIEILLDKDENEFKNQIIKVQIKENNTFKDIRTIKLRQELKEDKVIIKLENVIVGDYLVSILTEEGIVINMISFKVKKSKLLIGILGLLFAVSIGAFAYFNLDFSNNITEPVNKLLDSQGEKNLGDLSEDPEEKQKELNEAVEMVRISMNSYITVKNRTGAFNIQNKMQDCILQVVFYKYDKATGKTDKENPLYISPELNSSNELVNENTITPYYNGDYVSKDKLILDLEKGTYDCVAEFNKYDLEKNFLGRGNVSFILNVED